MTPIALVLLWVFILAVLLLSTPTECPALADDNVEGFHDYSGNYYKKSCSSCGWRSRYSCAKCTNCGYCIDKNGNGECKSGDSSGSFWSNNNDCMYWEYGSPSYYPYSHVFPVVKVKSIYPYYRWRLRAPYKLWGSDRRQRALDRAQRKSMRRKN